MEALTLPASRRPPGCMRMPGRGRILCFALSSSRRCTLCEEPWLDSCCCWRWPRQPTHGNCRSGTSSPASPPTGNSSSRTGRASRPSRSTPSPGPTASRPCAAATSRWWCWSRTPRAARSASASPSRKGRRCSWTCTAPGTTPRPRRPASQPGEKPKPWLPYVPDALVPIGSGVEMTLPAADNRVPDQKAQMFWLDVFVPKDAKPGQQVTLKFTLNTAGFNSEAYAILDTQWFAVPRRGPDHGRPQQLRHGVPVGPVPAAAQQGRREVQHQRRSVPADAGILQDPLRAPRHVPQSWIRPQRRRSPSSTPRCWAATARTAGRSTGRSSTGTSGRCWTARPSRTRGAAPSRSRTCT